MYENTHEMTVLATIVHLNANLLIQMTVGNIIEGTENNMGRFPQCALHGVWSEMFSIHVESWRKQVGSEESSKEEKRRFMPILNKIID